MIAQQKISAIPRWNLSKANWVLFQKEFYSVEDIISILDNPVDAYTCLEQRIISAVTRSIPKTIPSKGRPPVPWWDKTCKNLRKIALKYYDVYRANPPQTNKIIYHCALAKKKKYFKKAKVTSWQNYVSKVNKDTPTSCVWNKIRKLLGKYVLKPLPSLLVNNNLVTDPKVSSDVLAEHFSKISSQQSFSQDFRTAAREREYPEFSSGDSVL